MTVTTFNLICSEAGIAVQVKLITKEDLEKVPPEDVINMTEVLAQTIVAAYEGALDQTGEGGGHPTEGLASGQAEGRKAGVFDDLSLPHRVR
jgi:hypothetical protein